MVAKKMRGSGLLPHPDRIDRMLDCIMSGFSGRLSVKARLGRESAEEMEKLIPVFNRYPISRIIIHPRTGVQMYSGEVDLDSFQNCMQRLSHPLVFNGDINTLPTFRALADRFPSVSGWMLGRGLISNPFLAEMIHHDTTMVDRSKERFLLFHDELVDGYCKLFSGPGHVLDRMKGFWRYFVTGLSQGRRSLKRIRKSGSLDRYRQEVVKALSCQDEWGG
jgi:tRNA-dihydrouridine synthase